jgi:uncharacterized protein YndB with AHSA1/START domain
METIVSKTAVSFKAPIAKVWEGLTNPEIVKQYFFGTHLEADWKVGGKITFSGEWDGHKYQDGGIITAIDAPNYLKYTYWSSMSGMEDKPENYYNITYQLSEDEGVTTLTILQDGVKSQEASDHSADNWKMVFDGLRKIIE